MTFYDNIQTILLGLYIYITKITQQLNLSGQNDNVQILLHMRGSGSYPGVNSLLLYQSTRLKCCLPRPKIFALFN